jgi:hypothetical protein
MGQSSASASLRTQTLIGTKKEASVSSLQGGNISLECCLVNAYLLGGNNLKHIECFPVGRRKCLLKATKFPNFCKGKMMNPQEVPLFAVDLMQLLGVRHPNTLRLMIKSGRIPQPDVRISQKTRYWQQATLEKAGLLEPK